MKPDTTITDRLMRGGFWAAIGKVVFTLGTLAWNSLLTRVLSETEVGAFYLIASIVIFAELVVLGGMNQTVMRLIAVNTGSQSNVRAVIKGSAILVMVFSVSGGLLYYWLLGPLLGQQVFHSQLIAELAGFTVAWFTLRAVQTYIAFILRGFHKVGIAAFAEGATTAILITLALLILYIIFDQSDIFDVLSIVIGALICNIVLALMLVRKSYRKTVHDKGISLMEPLRIGAPLSILAISGVGMNEAHIWIAGAFASHIDVALYGAASRLAKFVQMPLLIINGVIPSTIAQLSAVNDKVRIEKILQTVATITALPSILITIIVFVFSEQILAIVFGSVYSSGSEILMILIFGQVLSVTVGSPGVLMAMSDRQKMLMIIGTCSGLTGIVVSVTLVGTQGIVGIAIGSVTGKILQNIVLWAYCLKVLKVKTHPSFIALLNVRNVLNKRK